MGIINWVKAFFKSSEETKAPKAGVSDVLSYYRFIIAGTTEPFIKNGVAFPDKTRTHLRVYQIDHEFMMVFEWPSLYTKVLGENQEKMDNAIARMLKLKRWKEIAEGEIDKESVLIISDQTSGTIFNFTKAAGYGVIPKETE